MASTQEVANSQGVVLGTLTGTVVESESAEGVANTAVAPSDSKESAEVGTSTKEDATKSPGVTTEVANPGLGLTWESF